MKKQTINLVPHTHWDREWYFTSAKSKIYLVNNMKEILDMLEQNSDYPCYVLDGQTVVLEDYLSLKPADRKRIKNLVCEGRLKIGPWYTQTDEMVVGGESIIRNLLYGKLDCDKFGSRMMIGYLPDSFGQSAAMPKILNGFGIEKSLFWRGYSQRLGINQTEFLWVADDGSKVVVQLLPINYSVGITIPNNVEDMHKQFDEYLKILSESSTTGQILVPNGHDQMPVQQNIFEIIELMKKEFPDFDIKLNNYENQFEDIDASKIYTFKGELLDGKYMRIHRSIYSSRADLKTSNTRIENKITNILEPIASIAYKLGFDYQAGTIEIIWREMLKNHAHDSICCCSTDNVNKQVERRFAIAEDLTDNLIDFYMRKFIEAIPGNEDKVIVFNTYMKQRNTSFIVDISTPYKNFDLQDMDGNLINFEIIDSEKNITRDESENKDKNYQQYKIVMYDELPAMGYKIYKILEADNASLSVVKSNENIIENEFYKIIVNKNGSLNIEDKTSGKIYKEVLLLEDSADGGDSYDYSPIENDFILTSEKCCAEINSIKAKNYEQSNVHFRMDVPKDLDSRTSKKIDSYVDVSYIIELEESNPLIKLKFNVNNQAKDHRLRVLIPQNLSAKNSISDIQFGKISRNVYDEAIEVWEKENWNERPDTIYPFLSYVHLDNEEGIAVLSNSVREYQVVDGNQNYDTIAITLFRSYGYQGRRDLLRRPGRASGTKTPTPDAQLIGHNSYELAMTTDIKNVAQLAKSYTTPIVYYAFDPSEDLLLNKCGFDIPQKFSLFNIENSGIILSSLKKEEVGECLTLRMYNSLNETSKLKLDSKCKIFNELMLDETHKNKLAENSEIEFKPFEIKTFLLK